MRALLVGWAAAVGATETRRLALDDSPTWATAVDPFNCTRYERPLQVLRRHGNTVIDLAQLALATGEYENLNIMTNRSTDAINAAAMYYSTETGESYPIAVFRRSDGTWLCRWSDNGMYIRRACFDAPNVGGHGWSYAAAIVNTTYYHMSGFGPGRLKVVQNVHTDTPTFVSSGTYRLRAGPHHVKGADMTFVTRRGCEDTGVCIKSDADDPYVSESTHFLVAIANNIKGLVIVSLSTDGIPLAYLYVVGLSIVIPRGDDTNATQVVDSISGFRATGACYTMYSPDGSITRVMCSSNGAKGLFEIQLPMDLSYCKEFWNTFDTTTGTALECDRTGAYVRKPVVGYVSPSAETYQNDGMTCLYTAAALEIPPLVIDEETQEELDNLTQAAPTLAPQPVPTLAPSLTLVPTAVPVQYLQGSLDELFLVITTEDPASYYINDDRVYVNGYILYTDPQTICSGMDLVMNLTMESSSTIDGDGWLHQPSVWNSVYNDITPNDVQTEWHIEGLVIGGSLTRVDFQVIICFDDAIVSVGDVFLLKFVLTYLGDTLEEDLTINIYETSDGNEELPEGSIGDLALELTTTPNPATYYYYDGAIWIDGYFEYSDAGNTILSDLDLMMALNSSASEGATLESPSVWGRDFDSISTNFDSTTWLCDDLDMDISRVAFQIIVRFDDSIVQIGDKFVVRFTLDHEGSQLWQDFTIFVADRNDFAVQGDVADLALILTTGDPVTYYIGDGGAVWINGHIEHYGGSHTIFRDLDLTMALNYSTTTASLDEPNFWGRDFEAVTSIDDGWFCHDLDLDISRVDFQVIALLDDDILEVGDAVVVAFQLDYDITALVEDLTIIVAERGEGTGGGGGGGGGCGTATSTIGLDEGLFQNLSFAIASTPNPTTYYIYSSIIWIDVYLASSLGTTGVLSNVTLVAWTNATSFATLDEPSIWCVTFDTMTPNDDRTRWTGKGLDMAVSQVDMQYRVFVDDAALIASGVRNFTVWFRFQYLDTWSEATPYVILVEERDNDASGSGNGTSFNPEDWPDGAIGDLGFGIVNDDPELYELGTGVIWINCHLSNIANESVILRNVSLDVRSFEGDILLFDTPSVWGLPFDSMTPNDDATRWHCAGLDLWIQRVDMQFRVEIDDSTLRWGDTLVVGFTYTYAGHSRFRNFTILVNSGSQCPDGDFEEQMVVSLVNPRTNPLRLSQAWTANAIPVDVAMHNDGTECLTDLRFRATIRESNATKLLACNDYAGFETTTMNKTRCDMTSPFGEGFVLEPDETRHVQVILFVDFNFYDGDANVTLLMQVYDEENGVNKSNAAEFVVAVRPWFPPEGDLGDIALQIVNPQANPLTYSAQHHSFLIHYDITLSCLMTEVGGFVPDVILEAAIVSATENSSAVFDSWIDGAGFSNDPVISASYLNNNATNVTFSTLMLYSYNILHVHFYVDFAHLDEVLRDDSIEVIFTAWQRGRSHQKLEEIGVVNVIAASEAESVVAGEWTVGGMSLDDCILHTDVFADAIATSAGVNASDVLVQFSTTSRRRRLDDSNTVLVSYEITVSLALSTDVVASMEALNATTVDAALTDAAVKASVSTAFADLVAEDAVVTASYVATDAPTSVPTMAPISSPPTTAAPTTSPASSSSSGGSGGGDDGLLIIGVVAGVAVVLMIAGVIWVWPRGEKVYLAPDDDDGDDNFRRVVVRKRSDAAKRIRHSFFVAYRKMSAVAFPPPTFEEKPSD